MKLVFNFTTKLPFFITILLNITSRKVKKLWYCLPTPFLCIKYVLATTLVLSFLHCRKMFQSQMIFSQFCSALLFVGPVFPCREAAFLQNHKLKHSWLHFLSFQHHYMTVQPPGCLRIEYHSLCGNDSFFSEHPAVISPERSALRVPR